jgi:hypothetical protein
MTVAYHTTSARLGVHTVYYKDAVSQTLLRIMPVFMEITQIDNDIITIRCESEGSVHDG